MSFKKTYSLCAHCKNLGFVELKNIEEAESLYCDHDVFLPGIGKISREVYSDILVTYFSYVNVKEWMLTDEEKQTFKFKKNLLILKQEFDAKINVRTPDSKDEFYIDAYLLYPKFLRSEPRGKMLTKTLHGLEEYLSLHKVRDFIYPEFEGELELQCGDHCPQKYKCQNQSQLEAHWRDNLSCMQALF